MSSKLSPVLMLVAGGVLGGGLVILLQRDDEVVVEGTTPPGGTTPAVLVAEENEGKGAGEDAPEMVGIVEEVAEPEAVSEEGGGPSFEDLMAKMFSGEASDDEQLAFWEQLRKTDKIDGVIEDLSVLVEGDPEDVTGRMTLAQLYIMKLLSVPPGPAQGLLSEKSQALWGQVLELEPDNFEAQYSIAFSLSQYPDFLGRTDEAIEAFEKAIAIEEKIGASEQTAQAYANLARLHKKSGDPASALEVLERGVKAHPDHGELGGQLEKLKKGFVFEEN